MSVRPSIQIRVSPAEAPSGSVDAPQRESGCDAEGPTVTVAGRDEDAGPHHSLAGLACWLVAGVALVCVAAWKFSTVAFDAAHPELYGGALVLGLSALVHALLGRPLARVIHQVRQESARLRAAMTCPYCRDGLEREATLCGRPGCGAVYHPECWEECHTGYGGCAVYGCGHTTGNAIGRFALQRRLVRLVIATVLFPPRAVAKLRELERQSFREVWRSAREHQRQISESPQRTVAYGALNAVACILAVGLVIVLTEGNTIRRDPGSTLLYSLPVFLLPFLFMRLPLLRAFSWGSAKVVAHAFRSELGALSRADRGTVLGRLIAGVGKKG